MIKPNKEPKTYDLKTMGDMLAIPAYKFGAFLKDLKDWHKLSRETIKMIDTIAVAVGEPKTDTSNVSMKWTDDGLDSRKIIIHATEPSPKAPSSDTKVSIQDVVNGTPAGQEAVQRALEASIKDQEAMSAKAQAIRSDTNELRQQIGNAMQCDDAEHLKDDTGEACYQCQIDKVMVIVRSKEAEAYHNGRYDLARSLIPVLEKELTELKGDI